MPWFARKDLEEKVTGLESENAELTSQLAAADLRVKELESAPSAAAEDLEKVKGELATAEASLTAEQEAHKATKAALTAEQAKTTPEAIALRIAEAHAAKDDPAHEKVASAVSSIVIAQVAAAGHPPLDLSPENPVKSNKEETDPTARALKNWSRKN